eukprot:3429516-Alexandrium_andersonii.AAC.1
MSASLVGSEMCIRDRPTVLHQAYHSAASSLRQLRAVSSAFEQFPAVSYTHLTLPTICSV